MSHRRNDRWRAIAEEAIARDAKVCVYVMTVDNGHAPNPFHGRCTLATCTPNHKRAKLKRGDWIVGLAGKRLAGEVDGLEDLSVLYAMRVEERLTLGGYYKEYREKRPKCDGTPEQRVGDAYYEESDGRLRHTMAVCSVQHCWDSKEAEQDMYGDRVFVSRHEKDERPLWWYFGRGALPLPRGIGWAEKLREAMEVSRIGMRYLYEGDKEKPWGYDDALGFVVWLLERGDAKRVVDMPCAWPPPEAETDDGRLRCGRVSEERGGKDRSCGGRRTE